MRRRPMAKRYPPCSLRNALKYFFEQLHEGGVGKGERNERDGDKDVHLEMQAGEFLVNDLESLQHGNFEGFELFINAFEPFVDALEPFFKELSRHKFVPKLILEFGFHELLLLEDFLVGSLLHGVNNRFHRFGKTSAFCLPPRLSAKTSKASRGNV